MSIRENKFRVLDGIQPSRILVSVFDKTGLDELVRGILRANPEAVFYSTGGTGKKITEILAERSGSHYVSVEAFTGAPEMEGGLVKTLHPKVHAGLLGERGNPAHEDYINNVMKNLGGTAGVYFDVLVGNLYPFSDVVTRPEATAEAARVNIDIGGPTMTMAAAKNWHSVAVLTDPGQYGNFISALETSGGVITARQRFALAQAAFRLIGRYRTAIADYFERLDFDRDILPGLGL